MSGRKNRLDRLQIANPCNIEWNRMAGGEQVRYCLQCDKRVYNFSKMTRGEAEAIVSAARGKLCARITRGADGTVVAEEARPALHLISRRASPVAAAVVTAILGISGSASAIVFPQAESSVSGPSGAGAKKPESQPRAEGGTASLSGRILDAEGAVIAGAKIVLTNVETSETHSAESSDEGRYGFASLKPGAYHLSLAAMGFGQVIEQMTLSQNQQQNFDVTMQVESSVTMGEIVISPPEPLRNLYFESDLIVVASVGKSVSLESKEHGEMMKTELRISSTIKGKGRKRVVYLHHWKWKDPESRFTEGDSLLFFLKPHANARDGYEVSQEMYGIKKLSTRDLSVYAERMRELEVIGEATRDNAEEMTEWLVRCAEDPATRWEGAYELAAWARATEQKKPEEPQEPNSESGEAATASAGAALNFAEMLTGKQRERLMTALFKTDPAGDGEGDLIELAFIWRDERLAPYLVSQLRRPENDAPQRALRWTRVLGELFDDEDLYSLVDKYYESADIEYNLEPESGEASIEQARRERSAILVEILSAVGKKMGEMKSKAGRD